MFRESSSQMGESNGVQGIFREISRRFYVKPSEKNVRPEAEASGRAGKLARKKAPREGLISRSAKKSAEK